MAIAAAAGRIGATLAAMIRTRLELAAVEVQEEAHHLVGYLAWMLLAAFLAAGAALFAALFVIVLFWDDYRLQAVGGMAALFALACAMIVMKVRASFVARPPLLAATLAELRKDVDFVKGVGQSDE